MSQRTALNPIFKGLVENLNIPVELHERDGKKYASFGSTIPIHCCTPEQVKEYADKTHHYCDVFSEELMAPLGELAYVRLDENTAEKVFINRTKRLLLLSSDGVLAQWRHAPTFESANRFVAGTPIVNKDGALVSVVTARSGSHYAVSTFEGEGGYFETSEPWAVVPLRAGAGAVYGTRVFASRAELRAHVSGLPRADVCADMCAGRAPRPALLAAAGAGARLVLQAAAGRQLAHLHLPPLITTDITYL